MIEKFRVTKTIIQQFIIRPNSIITLDTENKTIKFTWPTMDNLRQVVISSFLEQEAIVEIKEKEK